VAAKVSSEDLPERGSSVGLSLNTDRVYFFDAVTGKRIYGGDSAAASGDKGAVS
jgi:hypothetical protein